MPLQIPASRSESAMTFAHEVGHNLGANHDEESEPVACSPGFIMSTSGSSQAQPNFSECSIREMSREGGNKINRIDYIIASLSYKNISFLCQNSFP